MNKYQQALYASILRQFELWASPDAQAITHDELYRFLHSVRGTAGTIGLHDVSTAAANRMDALPQDADKCWTGDELLEELSELMEVVQPMQMETSEDNRHAADHRTRANQDQPLVLLVDSDPAYLGVMERQLTRRGYCVMTATQADDALELLHAQRPDCVVVELFMDSGSHVDLLSTLQAKMNHQFIPTTIVCEQEQDTTANRVKAFRLGADDYLTKPFALPDLCARLERQLARKRLFEQQSSLDGLTGTVKQSQLSEGYRRFAARQAEGRKLLLGLFDVRDLRAVNEQHGPLAGDAALQSAAELLLEHLPSEHSTVFRYEGSAFVLLLAEDLIEEAFERMHQLTVRLAAQRFLDGAPNSSGLSASVGLVHVEDRNRRLQDWIEYAGQALAQAKESGLPVSIHDPTSSDDLDAE